MKTGLLLDQADRGSHWFRQCRWVAQSRWQFEGGGAVGALLWGQVPCGFCQTGLWLDSCWVFNHFWYWYVMICLGWIEHIWKLDNILCRYIYIYTWVCLRWFVIFPMTNPTFGESIVIIFYFLGTHWANPSICMHIMTPKNGYMTNHLKCDWIDNLIRQFSPIILDSLWSPAWIDPIHFPTSVSSEGFEQTSEERDCHQTCDIFLWTSIIIDKNSHDLTCVQINSKWCFDDRPTDLQKEVFFLNR